MLDGCQAVRYDFINRHYRTGGYGVHWLACVHPPLIVEIGADTHSIRGAAVNMSSYWLGNDLYIYDFLNTSCNRPQLPPANDTLPPLGY